MQTAGIDNDPRACDLPHILSEAQPRYAQIFSTRYRSVAGKAEQARLTIQPSQRLDELTALRGRLAMPRSGAKARNQNQVKIRPRGPLFENPI